MVHDLLSFPPEIREQIYYYCCKSDLLNIACCSKECYYSVKYLLWNKIELTWSNVEKSLSIEVLENLKWTTSLRFYKEENGDDDDDDDFDDDEGDNEEHCMQFHLIGDYDDEEYEYIEEGMGGDEDEDEGDEGNDNNLICTVTTTRVATTNSVKRKEITWTDIASNYKMILSNCDPNKLIKLRVTGVIEGHGIQQTTDTLHNIQDLSLSDICLADSNGWLCLSKLTQLKNLSLSNCGIEDNSIEHVIAATNLSSLILNECPLIREDSLKYISSAIQLKKLTISHNAHIPANSFRVLGNLINLRQLTLEYTNINDFSLSSICRYWKNLESLNLYESVNITDTGLCCVTKLQSLKELNINMCTSITDVGFIYLQKMLITKFSFSWSNNVTDSVFVHLSNMSSLTELNIININNRFSVLAIDEYCRKTGMRKKTVFNSWIFSFFTLVKDD